MTRFVALLRGVNVGGHNRLPMADLRAALTDDGLESVRTYIQSGNIVLDSPAARSTSWRRGCGRSSPAAFALDIPVVALTADGLRVLAEANPFRPSPTPVASTPSRSPTPRRPRLSSRSPYARRRSPPRAAATP